MALALVVGISSCNSSSDDNPGTYMDFMTLISTGSTGSVFEMYNNESNTLLTLTSTVNLSDVKNVKVGERVILLYSYGNRMPYTSGDITVFSLSPVLNGELTVAPSVPEASFDDMQTQAVSVSGVYLNYQGSALYTENYNNMKLVLDEATMNNAMPDVYLVLDADSDNPAANWKGVFASFNISKIWTDSRYQGFTLHINDVNSNFRTLTFKRSEGIKPVK